LGTFLPFVTRLPTTAMDGLFQRVAGQDTKQDGNLMIQGDPTQSGAKLLIDVLIMGRFPAYDRAQRQDGCVIS
jgi:hypothetical protein